MRSLLSIFSFKNRNTAVPILLAVALVAVLETGFSFLPQNKLVKSLRSKDYGQDGAAADVEIMGDSVAAGGLLAGGFAGALPSGATISNLAMSATGPEFPYFLLKRQIAAGKAPKAIVYAPSPHTFASLRVGLLVSGYCTWPEAGEVALAGIHTCDVVYGAMCKVSRTLRYREELAVFVKGDPAKAAEKSLEELRKRSPQKQQFPPEMLPQMYKKGFAWDPFNLYFCKKFLSLAREHHIHIYWVTMPELPVVAESRKRLDFDKEYYAFLDKVAKDYGVTLFQKEFVVYADEEFRDYSHLNEHGAERYTAFIAGKFATVGGLTVSGRSSVAHN